MLYISCDFSKCSDQRLYSVYHDDLPAAIRRHNANRLRSARKNSAESERLLEEWAIEMRNAAGEEIKRRRAFQRSLHLGRGTLYLVR
ncbi:hypothetical protein [Azospirillum oryzae]|uniref:hypothetical protein n=1 Tax=Azospirillum oryzae TaxID=286727 RepID=UPI0011777009|nr:hypothetical protein [Azospirillum oryzae]